MATATGGGSRGDTVSVSLDEYYIDMPLVLEPGRAVFHVRNAGFEEHDFVIVRDSLRWELATLNPGGQGVLEIGLEPGAYRVLCSISGHDGRGMTMEIRVEEDPP